MALSKQEILSASDSGMEAVEVPEWGGAVNVRVMSGEERDRWESETLAFEKVGNQGVNVRARLCIATVCDDDGVNLFTSADCESLGAKSSAVLDRIFDVAIRVNKLGKADMEKLEGNS